MNPWIEVKLYYMFDNLDGAHRPLINFYRPIFNVKSLLTYSLHILQHMNPLVLRIFLYIGSVWCVYIMVTATF